MAQMPPKKYNFTQFAAFFHFLLIKINYYFVLFEGCVLPILSFLYFKSQLVRACSGAHFQNMTFCGSPVAPMFVLRNKLLFCVPECARPRALKVMETIVYRGQQKQDTKCTTYKH